MNQYMFSVGDRVKKRGGDYKFDGVVVARFLKLSGLPRYVVEDDRGVLHIYNAGNLMKDEDTRSNGTSPISNAGIP